MKKSILTILLVSLLSMNFLRASAYDFTSDYKAKVLSVSDTKIQLKITEAEAAEEGTPFPIGSVINLSVKEIFPKKRPIRDAHYATVIDSISLPSGEVMNSNREFNIRPRKFFNVRNSGSALIGAAGLTLTIVIDGLTVGLPVARGGKALWDMGYEIYDTPKSQSKFKNGAKGFVLGALFPIPQLFIRGRSLDIHEGSTIFISETDDPEKPVYGFLVRRLN
jgi:hypothetical protein